MFFYNYRSEKRHAGQSPTSRQEIESKFKRLWSVVLFSFSLTCCLIQMRTSASKRLGLFAMQQAAALLIRSTW